MINICFHGIGSCIEEREAGESRYWVDQDRFLAILDVIQHYQQVRLSFDDGNASDVEIALPALVERRLRATFFAIAGRLGSRRSISADDLRLLRSLGMGIGSHGWDHVPWRGLNSVQQQREFVEARTALVEASGGPVDQAALPLGRYDRNVLAALRRHGYRTVFSSDKLLARPGAWLQGRYSLTRDDTPESVRSVINDRASLRRGRDQLASLVKRLR